MKVLFALHGFPPELGGGTERTVLALARAMRAAGHDLVVVAGTLERGDCSRVDRSEHDGVRVLRMHRDDLYFEDWYKAWSPQLSERFAALLRAERPDVVHVQHWLRLSSDLVRVARDAGCTTAVTAHDYFPVLADPVRRVGDDAPRAPEGPEWLDPEERAEAFALHRLDLADELRAAHVRFAPSRAHAEGLAALAPAPLGPFALARPPGLAPVPRRSAPAGPRGRRLLTWGSIYPDKGLDLVLDALNSVGGWTLDVFGEAHEPTYRERLRQRSEHLPFVRFHGAFDGPGALAAVEADYALLPTICHESYGLVLDEAQALGLPVLAADVPAYRERAAAESTALFAPGDAGDLAMLLLDEARLAALRPSPPPAPWTAADAAAALLGAYDGADRSASPPAPLLPAGARAVGLFRRAERRLHAALQHGPPQSMPTGFLSRWSPGS